MEAVIEPQDNQRKGSHPKNYRDNSKPEESRRGSLGSPDQSIFVPCAGEKSAGIQECSDSEATRYDDPRQTVHTEYFEEDEPEKANETQESPYREDFVASGHA